MRISEKFMSIKFQCSPWGIQMQPALEDFTAGHHMKQTFTSLAVISEIEGKFIFASASKIFNFMLCVESLTSLILKQVVLKVWNGSHHTHITVNMLMLS